MPNNVRDVGGVWVFLKVGVCVPLFFLLIPFGRNSWMGFAGEEGKGGKGEKGGYLLLGIYTISKK